MISQKHFSDNLVIKNIIKSTIRESIRVKEDLYRKQIVYIEKAARVMIASLRRGGKILIFGNGGSAADSQHIAAELVGRFKAERRPLAAIALTTNTSTISAVANDYGYEVTFSRQLEALAKKDDVAIGISTSGNSPNVLAAIKKAKSLGVKTIALTGGAGGKLKTMVDIAIVVASHDTPRIQESHILIGHILCELVEEGIFS